MRLRKVVDTALGCESDGDTPIATGTRAEDEERLEEEPVGVVRDGIPEDSGEGFGSFSAMRSYSLMDVPGLPDVLDLALVVHQQVDAPLTRRRQVGLGPERPGGWKQRQHGPG